METPLADNDLEVDESGGELDLTKLKVPESWEKVFEEARDEFESINEILNEQIRVYGRILPDPENIFKAFELTKLPDVKVVIIGQDPYHQLIKLNGKNVPRAQGLSFSVHRDDQIPSSLNNIFIELKNTVKSFRKPVHGDLSRWAKQGVLMLNMSLTVNPNMAGSHGDIWMGFIDRVIKAISKYNKNCIYVLWGREAQKLERNIGGKGIALTAAHPSGLSAHRGFFGCDHFNKINEILESLKKEEIDWNIDPVKITINRNKNVYIEPKKIEYKEIVVTNDVKPSADINNILEKKVPPIKFN